MASATAVMACPAAGLPSRSEMACSSPHAIQLAGGAVAAGGAAVVPASQRAVGPVPDHTSKPKSPGRCAVTARTTASTSTARRSATCSRPRCAALRRSRSPRCCPKHTAMTVRTAMAASVAFVRSPKARPMRRRVGCSRSCPSSPSRSTPTLPWRACTNGKASPSRRARCWRRACSGSLATSRCCVPSDSSAPTIHVDAHRGTRTVNVAPASGVRRRRGNDAAAMRGDDAVGDGQAEAGATPLRITFAAAHREERLEHVRQVRGGDAGAAVGHVEAHLLAGGCDHGAQRAAGRHRLQGPAGFSAGSSSP